MVHLSIVIPAFNEAERIAPTLERYDEWLAAYGLSYEIVVSDDGSTDATAAVVEALGARRPRIRLVGSIDNRGKGHAVRIGMLAARGVIRVMTDADGSVGPEQLPKLIEVIERGAADVAIGSRYLDDAAVAARQPLWRVAWSRMANWVVRKTLVDGIADTQCGFKAFHGPLADRIFAVTTVDGWSFDLEVLVLAQRWGAVIDEVPVTWTDDDRSRVSPMQDLLGVVREWFAIRRVRGRLGAPVHRPALEAGPSW